MPDLCPVFRLVFFHPQKLCVTKIRIDPVAGDVKEKVFSKLLSHLGAFCLGAAVHPDDDRTYRVHLCIAHNARSAVQCADTDGSDLFFCGDFRDDLTERADGGFKPYFRVLLRPVILRF